MSQKSKTMKILEFDEFPELLKEINDPPDCLYIEGSLPSPDMKLLCVVGSRKNSDYGREVCYSLIEGLRGYPVVIVSGLALGTDTHAHKAALKNGIKTIAVPGSGLNEKVLYPADNRKLGKEIIKAGGCILTEFVPDFKATLWSFPQRNRIMAGMSHATLIIEATDKSGTLITSRLATEYNREVLAVPGPIFSPTSYGPHMLIRLGATPITCSEDILTALGFGEQKLFKERNTDPNRYIECSADELKVIELLKFPKSKDELVRELTKEMTMGNANMLISLLEIKNLIKESLGEFHLT